MKYFKGRSKKSGAHMVFVLYDEPQEKFGNESFIIEASELQKSGRKCYPTTDECDEENYVEREIGEGEYRSYKLIQQLLTEMYMNQYTGGFPRMENIHQIVRNLPAEIRKFEEEVKKR